MDDSPSIVPDLIELISLAAAHVALPDKSDADKYEIERSLDRIEALESAIVESTPDLAPHAKIIRLGAKQALANRSNAAASASIRSKRKRNVLMAAEYIARRADPFNDDVSDTRLMERVGALPPYNLSTTQARLAILAGLRDLRK